ncbi:MAG: response regulator [Terriglobia bacterium]
MSLPIAMVRIQYEHDVVACRQRARQIAEAFGFEKQQQTRLATAVSEIARNTYMYGGGGEAEFYLEGTSAPQLLGIRISDKGPGIPHLDVILSGHYRSETGMGLGILGAKRLMDIFTVNTVRGGGAEVILGKMLPRRSPVITPQMLPRLIAQIQRQNPKNILDEFRDQTTELMRTLDELRKRQEELLSLNRELEDTNRGVVALYAELDERADHLRRADEVKSRFLSNMSHEIRTPLNSILALSRMLGERTDGDLTSEQEIQVNYIRKAAETLFELVNDLLDLAKVEAGKMEIHPVEFEINNVFGALRGMLRPLLIGSALNLVFDDAADCPPVVSDEGKISQILRNFISNALKFTEAGEVRVRAEYNKERDLMTFHVRDTGIGIAADDIETIFHEFAQLDSAIQRKVRGTGLGLPLSRKLAGLLGGSVHVESELGVGSTFSLRIPRVFEAAEDPAIQPETAARDPSRRAVLIVEDNFETRLIYSQYLKNSHWQPTFARSTREAENALRNVQPAVILLDILLEGEDTWDLLARLKSDPATKSIPVLVATEVDDRGKALALGADAFTAKPLDRETLIRLLSELTEPEPETTILLIDDEDISRYLLRQIFRDSKARIFEAPNGAAGLELARSVRPNLVIMDLIMPEMDGFETIEKMRADPALSTIPIIVSTSLRLADAMVRGIEKHVLAVLSKDSLREGGIRDTIGAILEAAGLGDLAGRSVGHSKPVLS